MSEAYSLFLLRKHLITGKKLIFLMIDGGRGLRGNVDSMGDAISKRGSSGVYLRARSVRDGECGQGSCECGMRLI
jgi:hypothetical protein